MPRAVGMGTAGSVFLKLWCLCVQEKRTASEADFLPCRSWPKIVSYGGSCVNTKQKTAMVEDVEGGSDLRHRLQKLTEIWSNAAKLL